MKLSTVICYHNGLCFLLLSLLYAHTVCHPVGSHQPSEASTKGNGNEFLYHIYIISVTDEVRYTLH